MATVAERLVACRHLLTSLPYIDDDLLGSVPGMQDRVEALIAEEMGRFTPPDYVAAPHPSATATAGLERLASGGGAASGPARPTSAAGDEGGAAVAAPQSLFLAEELARVAAGRGMEQLPTQRYCLPRPADAQADDAGAWRGALANAQSQLQHQDTRMVNLELLKTFSVRAWRSHAEAQEQLAAAAEARRDAAQSAAEELNVRRRTVQERHADKIARLSRKRHELVYSNARLENAAEELEREVKRLRAAAQAKGIALPANDGSAAEGMAD